MYRTGHQGVNLLLFAPVFAALANRGHLGLGLVGLLVVFTTASLPDIDLKLPLVAHRGITHTVWAAAAAGLAVVGPVYYYRNGIVSLVPELGGYSPLGLAIYLGAFLSFSVLGHLVGDVLTPMGIRPFAPLSNRSFSLDLWPADSIANKALFGVGVVAVAGAGYVVGGV